MLQNSNQKMYKEAAIKYTRVGPNTKGTTQESQAPFATRTTPGVRPVIDSKKGKHFASDGAAGFEGTLIITRSS